MDLFQSLIRQESSGRPGILGPRTKYGQAQGLTQMLPATAEEMARKIGVQWNPQMMTDKSPQGAAYQRQLGEAYFNEGLEKTGNPRDALRYYHGGPNRAQWGPKTNAYADSVLSRVDGGQQPMIRPRKPQTLADTQGIDPLAPLPAMQGPLSMAALPGAGGGSGAPGVPDLPDKQKFFGKGGPGWMILGALGDGLAQRNGMQPTFAPMYSRMKQQEFDREEMHARLEAHRQEVLARASEPPAFVRNAQTYAGLPQDVQRQVADFYSVTNPQFTNIENADGSVTRQPVSRGPQAGPQAGAEEDGYIFMGGDPADPQNWKAR